MAFSGLLSSLFGRAWCLSTRSLTSVIGQPNIPGIPFKPDVSISKISQNHRCHFSRIESRYEVSEGTETKSQLVAVESKPIIYIVPIWYAWFKLEPKSGTTDCSECLWIFGSFLCFSMAQTVQKGRKNVASGPRHRQADSSDSSPVPVPAKKKTATARKSTGGKPPSGRGRDEIASAGPRGGRSTFVHCNCNSQLILDIYRTIRHRGWSKEEASLPSWYCSSA